MLLAWSEIAAGSDLARIHIGLLDNDARLISAITALDAAGSGRHATDPVVATNGDGFFAAWIEREAIGYEPRFVAGVRLDASGLPVGRVTRYGAAAHTPPLLLWDGGAYRLWAGPFVHQIAPEGSSSSSTSTATPQFGFASDDGLALVYWQNVPPCVFYRCGINPSFELKWTLMTGKRSQSGHIWEYGYESDPPAVAGDAGEFLIVWRYPMGLRAMRVTAGRGGGTFDRRFDNGAAATPVMAFDGAEYLLVFRQRRDLFGILLGDEDEIGEPFPITFSSVEESDVRVFAVARGRFLVAYTTGDDRLAGRFVVTSPSKRRSVR